MNPTPDKAASQQRTGILLLVSGMLITLLGTGWLVWQYSQHVPVNLPVFLIVVIGLSSPLELAGAFLYGSAKRSKGISR